MTLLHSARAGIYGSVALTPPEPLGPFDSPGTPAPGVAKDLASVTSNAVTAAVGDRIVALFAQTRGSGSSTTSPLRSLSSISGNGDFAGLDFDIATEVVAAHSQTFDSSTSGVRASIATLIVPADKAGTGTFTLTWSGTAWASLLQAFALPPSSLVASVAAGAEQSVSTIALATAETLEANDLVFSVASQLESAAITIPTGFTSAADYSNAAHNRIRSGWKNGTLASPFTWSGLYTAGSGVPKAAAAAIFRRSEI